MMNKLSSRLDRHHWIVLSIWAALIIASIPFAIQRSAHLSVGGFSVPGSQSASVSHILEQHFSQDNVQLAVVLAPGLGSASSSRGLEAARLTRLAAGTRLAQVSAGAARAAVELVTAGHLAVLPVLVRGSEGVEPEVAARLRTRLLHAAGAPVSAYVIGRGALDEAVVGLSEKQLAAAEDIGFPFLLLILLLIFGSIFAAMLPVLLGVVAITLTGASIFLLSQTVTMSVLSLNVASMIGIGVAVDYSLFILVRYREERRNGSDPAVARATALSTSGVAITFSGVAVVCALAGLFLIDDAAVRSMALGGIIVVIISMALAITLLPQLIRLVGARLEYRRSRLIPGGLRWPAVRVRTSRPRTQDFWDRWTMRIMRRPLLYASAATLALLALAAPALSLVAGEDFLHELPPANDTRVGYERAAVATGEGSMSPFDIVLQAPAGTGPIAGGALRRVRAIVARDREVQRIIPTHFSDDRRIALIVAYGRHFGDDPASRALVGRLRAELPAAAGPGTAVLVGGATAFILDGKTRVFGGLWKAALFAFVMTCLLMMVLLRSIVIPLKGAAMTFLSVGAAFGVMVIVFQWGWLDGVLGLRSVGFIDQTSPALVLAVVFGLSMDYEIFLLSRIVERFRRTGDLTESISHGLASSARAISGAALIMVSVFAVFIGTSMPAVKEVGLGLAVGVAIDATLVRLVLVPAMMQLLGRWNWWVPRWMVRYVPATVEASERSLQASAVTMGKP